VVCDALEDDVLESILASHRHALEHLAKCKYYEYN